MEEIKFNVSNGVIDENLIHILNVLNEKGWITRFCCEGHLNDNSTSKNKRTIEAYILFDKEYDFPFYSEHCIVEKSKPYSAIKNVTTLRWRGITYSKNKEKQDIILQQKKNEYLKEITEWAEKLPKNY